MKLLARVFCLFLVGIISFGCVQPALAGEGVTWLVDSTFTSVRGYLTCFAVGDGLGSLVTIDLFSNTIGEDIAMVYGYVHERGNPNPLAALHRKNGLYSLTQAYPFETKGKYEIISVSGLVSQLQAGDVAQLQKAKVVYISDRPNTALLTSDTLQPNPEVTCVQLRKASDILVQVEGWKKQRIHSLGIREYNPWTNYFNTFAREANRGFYRYFLPLYRKIFQRHNGVPFPLLDPGND